MELQGDQIALYLSGQDVPVQECNIIIHQPTIKQIVMFKETSFISITQFFNEVDDYISQLRQRDSSMEQFTDFQLLMAIINQDKQIKQNVHNFFELVFPRYKVDIRDGDICFYENSQRVGMVNPYNYKIFCDTIGILFSFSSDKTKYNPANKKAKQLAEKFKERERMLAKKKGQEKKSPSLFGSYVSVLSVGMNLDLNILFNYTPFQLFDIFNRYWKKVNSDFYQRVSTMPMMDTSKMEEPENWTNNLY